MKLISLEMLSYFKGKIEEIFVKKELKTGSDTEYKVLSDHNLTDELVEKINAAGAAADVTAEIATAKTEAVTESKNYTDEQIQTFKDDVTDGLASDISEVSDRVTEIEESMATDAELSSAIEAAKTELNQAIATATDDMATQTWVNEQVATATDDMATNASVDEKIAEAKTELTTTINEKISTAYKIKGSTAFANLPALSETEEGHVYNVTDAFTATADFVEGEGKKYPAGSNVVCIEQSEGVFKWDVLAGFIDTDTFVKNTDIETITEAEIDALFAS